MQADEAAASIALTWSNVSECSRTTLAAAETSRLLTCSDAATSYWLIPPFATARRIFLYLLMGTSPFRCHSTPDWVHDNGC